jgi:hypothetical protein
VVSPLIMSADELQSWKARERQTPIDIEREGIAL